ncbi:hypothetical protein VF21_09515 [Pseudogymnoascus sp. 05NY08]|nr:hypothetical protein VF21_09515 [Pseudogymnoascus sp. 05NY08]
MRQFNDKGGQYEIRGMTGAKVQHYTDWASNWKASNTYKANPFTLGFFGTPEIRDSINLKVKGKIPHWVSGSLYRGAAATWDNGNYTAELRFDGFSRNHRFEVSDGKVSYHSRNANSKTGIVRETGLFPGGSFGGDPCKVIFGAFRTTYRDGINPVGDASTGSVTVSFITNFPGLDRNVSETEHGPFVTLVKTTDGDTLQQLDPVSLEPIELFTYQTTNTNITGDKTCAHPAHGKSGELYNYMLNTEVTPPEYSVFEINSLGKGSILATITDAPAAYIHSMFSTANYVILIVWQSDFGKETSKPYYNVLDNIKDWDPERKTLFYVIDKVKGGVVAKYTSETFFAFHEINSFEDSDGSIVIDLPAMKTNAFLEAARLKNLRTYVGHHNATAPHDLPGTFRRFRLQDYAHGILANGTLITRPAVTDFELDFKSGNIELPRFNQAYHGKPYRYAYGIHIKERGFFTDSLIKVDTHTRRTTIWKPRTPHLPSEPVFVANPKGTCEDDGVLLTMALEANRKQSVLVVIDAKSMKEIARAEMPLVAGFGFHGIWGNN